MSEGRFLGIDFSGAAAPWKPTCGRARQTVWIATLEAFRLTQLIPVQELDGKGHPFDRLVALLATGKFRAAAIDAPFSIPAAYVPASGHKQLLKEVVALGNGPDRPFPLGPTLIAMAERVQRKDRHKPLRETENACSGANPRSTLWWKPRGGAPFAAACITLLARAGRPIWPWEDGQGMLVEAFPAAQLRAWNLPSSNYSKPDQKAAREKIIAFLENERGLIVEPAYRKQMIVSPDALDAVIAAFGGRAAANRQLKHAPPKSWRLEGAIAVHA